MPLISARLTGAERLKIDLYSATMNRLFDAANISEATKHRLAPLTKLADSSGFGSLSGIDLCKRCLEADGVARDKIDRTTNAEVAQAAFGFAGQTSLRNEAVHVTSTLAEITRDAVNKSLQAGYEESPSTWQAIFRSSTTADFKAKQVIQMSGAPNLPIWPDNTVPQEARLTDQRIPIAVEARAEMMTFSWRLFVNDDMDALTRVPSQLGDAAARTVNKVAWSIFTGNPTMPYDSVSLFATATGARHRTNLTTGAGTPTTSTVGTLSALMRLMRGLNTAEGNESDDILNLTPSFIVGPASLESVIKQLVNSTADPANDKSSAVFNTAGTLKAVIEPLLDGDSATAWYLACDQRRAAAGEVVFLAGQETPVSNDWIDDATMSRNFSIVQTFGAGALDHRAVQKHAGA